MSKGDFSHRVVMPVSMVLITMLLSRMVYFNSSATVATLSGLVMFLSIAFGSFLIYPMTFFRGASIPERVIGCLVSPMVWNGIEMYNVGEAFTVSESLFYGLNIIFLATVASQFLIMGICDVFCRLLERRHTGEVRKAVGLFSVLACLFGIFGIYLVLIWREGVGLYYLWIDLYKKISWIRR